MVLKLPSNFEKCSKIFPLLYSKYACLCPLCFTLKLHLHDCSIRVFEVSVRIFQHVVTVLLDYINLQQIFFTTQLEIYFLLYLHSELCKIGRVQLL